MRLSDRVAEYILKESVGELDVLSVKAIALVFNIDRRHLWRVFKNEKGVTLESFLFRIKINEASSLLVHYPQLSVKEIAGKIGYSRCDYFIRVFKEYFGTTPGKFRDLKSNAKRNAV